MNTKLKNKVVLITGAAKGIGQAIAKEFAQQGATVIINYNKSEEEAKKTVELITSLGGKAEMIQADISTPKQIHEMMERIIKKFKKIDILVNNAAVFPRARFIETKEEDFDRIMDINVKGTYFCSKEFAELILPKDQGVIINISSNAGLVSKKDKGLDYAMSKAAVIHLTKSLAITLAPNIRINCVAPGYTETEMVSFHKKPELKKSKEERIPLKRINTPEDIAKAALFLASEDSRNITGEVLTIDGGYNLS